MVTHAYSPRLSEDWGLQIPWTHEFMTSPGNKMRPISKNHNKRRRGESRNGIGRWRNNNLRVFLCGFALLRSRTNTFHQLLLYIVIYLMIYNLPKCSVLNNSLPVPWTGNISPSFCGSYTHMMYQFYILIVQMTSNYHLYSNYCGKTHFELIILIRGRLSLVVTSFAIRGNNIHLLLTVEKQFYTVDIC